MQWFLPVDRQGNVQAGRRSIFLGRASKRAPRRFAKHLLTMVALAAALGWGIAPVAAGLQVEGSPGPGTAETSSSEAASPSPFPPEMFRNDPDRNGRAGGPGPIDTDQIEELWSFEAGGDVESSPAVVGGVVYFGSHRRDAPTEHRGQRDHREEVFGEAAGRSLACTSQEDQ